MFFDIESCEKCIGYSFNDKNLLKRAFTHKSYAYEHSSEHNELLEFFGDSILGFIIAEYLFTNANYGKDEGDLTAYKAGLVSKKPLSQSIRRHNFQKFLLRGNSLYSETISDSLCENLFEALVAAIYLDGGIEPCKKFVFGHLCVDDFKNLDSRTMRQRLQEYVQSIKAGQLSYIEISKTGPDNDPCFTMGVELENKIISTGSGKNKSEAKENAAATAYNLLTGRK